MKKAFLAVALASCLAFAGCESLGLSNNNPCEVAGATEAETPKLCVIRGALTVRAAYAATADQLRKGAITADEAATIKESIDKAAAAVDVAEAALAAGDASLDDKLVILEGWVLDLLRKQAGL